MSEYRRNIAVGVTVLVGLVALGAVIVLFGEVPALVRSGYVVEVSMPGAGGVSEGAAVNLNGKQIGKVGGIYLREDPREGVVLVCHINDEVRIPAQPFLSVYTTSGAFGSATVELATINAPGSLTFLPTDGSAGLVGEPGSSSLIPPEIAEKLESISEGFAAFEQLAQNLNRLIEPLVEPVGPGAGQIDPATQAVTPAQTRLAQAMDNLSKALEGLAVIAGDPENQENFRVALANLRQTSESAAAALEDFRAFSGEARQTIQSVNRGIDDIRQAGMAVQRRVDEVAAQLVDSTDQLSRLLMTLNQAATRLATGEGTAGRLLNDPELYNSLVDAMRQLERTMTEMQTALQVWRTEGIRTRLR